MRKTSRRLDPFENYDNSDRWSTREKVPTSNNNKQQEKKHQR